MKIINLFLFSFLFVSCASVTKDKIQEPRCEKTATLEAALFALTNGDLRPVSELPADLIERENQFESCSLNGNYECLLELAKKPITKKNLGLWKKNSRGYRNFSMEKIGFQYFENQIPKRINIIIKVRTEIKGKKFDDVTHSSWEKTKNNEWILVDEFGSIISRVENPVLPKKE